MEFHQLTYFLAAAQTQNFRKAAELCIRRAVCVESPNR